MDGFKKRLKEFVDFTERLKGDEKGEAQLFIDRFFRAFGHGGVIEANGTLEARIKFDTGRTKFADCLWAPAGRDGILIEMKRRGTKNLEGNFPQLRDYWIEMNPDIVIGSGAQKPTYAMLCNFDEFILYKHLSLVDRIKIEELPDRGSAFNFMLPTPKEPHFRHNIEAISKDAARAVGELFKYLTFDLHEQRERAQRFILQCVLSLFSEDFGLLPDDLFTEIVFECKQGASSYDLMGGLFRQMANPKQASGGRFQDIHYFNGGLFSVVDPIDLDDHCIDLLARAAEFNWKYVNPSIFGSLFEGTMNQHERHAFGAHFTSEQDILKIVGPTITRPWAERIDHATTLTDLTRILHELSKFKVLDPACGSGNFLYMAYRVIKDLEMRTIEKISSNFTSRATGSLHLGISKVNTRQFYGIDVQPMAVEVAKMTMMLAKELAASQWNDRISPMLATLDLSFDKGLPLDVLDDRIVCKDAILEDWPLCDAIIGNPPFQSKNKMKGELNPDYVDAIRKEYPGIPGRSDYCVYWFRKTHDHLRKGQRAGLVGTNTIRQNYSREGGLDHIIGDGGTITDAVSSQVWSGDAAVYVSIVNWIKDHFSGRKNLSVQKGDSVGSPFEYAHPKQIGSSLSMSTEVTTAKKIEKNASARSCYQGQTHGHEGFLISAESAQSLLKDNPNFKKVLHPYIIANDLIGRLDSRPTRYVIDFRSCTLSEARGYSDLYQKIEREVYPWIKEQAESECTKTGKDTGPRQSHARRWWKFWRTRDELMNILASRQRYVACARVTRRPIFEFVSTSIHPNDALQVFPTEDEYSFGILQSSIHWQWFIARCSTLKSDWRYTSNTVFDSFPWPQKPSQTAVENVAVAGKNVRKVRRTIMQQHGLSLREVYRFFDESTDNELAKAHAILNEAVGKAYGFRRNTPILEFLLDLNLKLAATEQAGKTAQGPGIPAHIVSSGILNSNDSVSM
jgi:hypothetical protein